MKENGGQENPPNPDKDDYKVGYKKPPEHSRFQKGQSGNKNGRPKGTKNLKTDLVEVLREKITIRQGERTMKVTKQRGFVLSLVAKALKGDSRASNVLLTVIGRIIDPDSGLNMEPALTAEEREVLESVRVSLAESSSFVTKTTAQDDRGNS
jgi:uncharacterized protein DUF5681